jgi:putative salt-induced outer membrane protein
MECVRRVSVFVFVFVLVLASARPLLAQPTCPCPPPEPPPGNWVGSAGLGFALNHGNTDTTNLNVTFDAAYDPKTRDVWRFRGLYQRGETDGEVSVDRMFFEGRYERRLSTRLFLFGQTQYLRDEFKEIDYLVATSGGVGYRLVETDTVLLSVDGGAGVSWEKNPGFDVDPSAVLTSGDQFTWKVSPNATITQGFTALWKADDFGDALYTFSAGISTSVLKQIELKLELLNAYKTKPPNDLVENNDVAFLTTVVYKF